MCLSQFRSRHILGLVPVETPLGPVTVETHFRVNSDKDTFCTAHSDRLGPRFGSLIFVPSGMKRLLTTITRQLCKCRHAMLVLFLFIEHALNVGHSSIFGVKPKGVRTRPRSILLEVHAVALRRSMSMHGHTNKETANSQSARYGYTRIASRTSWGYVTAEHRSLMGCHTHKVSVPCRLIPVGTRAIHKRTNIIADPVCDHRKYSAPTLPNYGRPI